MTEQNAAELAEVMEKYRSAVYGTALANTRCRSDADDVYQEVFLLYYTKDLSFESEAQRRAWLIRTCINRCRTLSRSAWYSKRSDEDVELFPDGSAATPAEREVWQAVRSLNEKYRTVVYLFYFENMPAAEIADALGVSEGAVNMRLTRARKQLKASLKEGDYFG